MPEGTSPSYDCAWKLQPANVDLRLGVQGQPVKATDKVVVVHAFTNKRLALTPLGLMGDMGMEAAVCCHTYSEPRKINKMQRENSAPPMSIARPRVPGTIRPKRAHIRPSFSSRLTDADRS